VTVASATYVPRIPVTVSAVKVLDYVICEFYGRPYHSKRLADLDEMFSRTNM
jgi:hypothetical protein